MPRPASGLDADARLRAEVAALLRGGNAHADARSVLDGIPFERVNERPNGLPYALWDLVYHLWYAQHDILVFSINADYKGGSWPTDYWPSVEATPESWADTVQAFFDDQDRLVYTKTKTRVVFLPAAALEVQEARSKQERAVEAARSQRERIIL